MIKCDDLTAFIIDDFDRDKSKTIVVFKENKIIVRLENDRWYDMNVLNEMNFLIYLNKSSFANESSNN